MLGIRCLRLFGLKFVFLNLNFTISLIFELLICFNSYSISGISNFSDSSLVNNPSKYSYKSLTLFKSRDQSVPEHPKKMVISKDFKQLYFLTNKGINTLNLDLNQNSLTENKLIVARGTHANASASQSFASDSSQSIGLNFQNQLIKLQRIYEAPLRQLGTVQRRVTFTNVLFPYDDFIVIGYNGYQYNNFDILNIITGKDGFYYFTAINDKIRTIDPSGSIYTLRPVTVGGSDIDGVLDYPNLYKFQDGKKLDGSDYNSISSSPKALKIGSGNCVFVDSKGSFYTIEPDRILKWSQNSSGPTLVAGGFGKGNLLNQLNLNTASPNPIEIDSDENLYINDYYNKRVVFWKKGASAGEVLISDKIGDIPNFYPNSIVLDQSKNLYISDSGVNSQVVKFFNCNYLIKPTIQKTSSNELSTLNQGKVRWYLNSQLISGVNDYNFKPKISGYYRVQDEDINGCKSIPSDSIYYECAPAKPEVALVGNTELKVNLPKDDKLYANFNYNITNYGFVKFVNLSSNFSNVTWYFPDGTISTATNPSKYFTVSGIYNVKLEVKNIKGESSYSQNIINISYPIRPNIVYNDLGNRTYFLKSLEREGVISWDFGDGTNSFETSPTHKYTNPGVYTVKVNLQGTDYTRLISIIINTNLNEDLSNGKVIDLPIYNDISIFNDISGFQNHANFNGKNNKLTSQGIYPNYSFSSIKLPGCTSINKNERIKIPNSQSINDLSEMTFSGWFGFDPSVSMFPGDGSCGPNGRQVLFSRGGDGFGTSPPGFNCLIDVTDKKLSLLIEFSKKSGDFSYNYPITSLLDTVKVEEKYEFVYNGKVTDLGYQSVEITKTQRLGPKESPFQHFVISFSKNRIKVFVNGRKIIDDSRTIYFDEINQQDIYIGAMGPKSTAVNSISNWYPFNGRIDRIKVFNRVLSDLEANALYLEKNSNE